MKRTLVTMSVYAVKKPPKVLYWFWLADIMWKPIHSSICDVAAFADLNKRFAMTAMKNWIIRPKARV